MSKLISLSEFEQLQASTIEKYGKRELTINVGMATCGIASGANQVYDALKSEIKNKNLDNIILKSVGCLGECYNEPIVEVKTNDISKKYNNVSPDNVTSILDDVVNNSLGTDDKSGKQLRIVLANCGVINPEEIDEYISVRGYEALAKVLFKMTSDDVIDVVKSSGLRGRGGAGFPTGIKWESAKKAESDQKYVVCNADEGDPGAFMDRAILEGDPHKVLEAMTICGHTIGANTGIIYIRAEYPLAVKKLENAIAQATEYGLLGDNILGTDFSFNITLNLGAGAFVCGEETSLLNSVEGKRGEPRVKPPFPAFKGLFDKPTNINNVETYANISPIILNGAEWFNKVGTEKSKGTKVFALAGKINKVGLIEVPMGTTFKEIIYEIGGGIINDKKFKAVQTGGPSGGCIPASMLDTEIDYDSLQRAGSMMGSGGIIVMDEDDCMVDIAKYYLDFTVDESCGKCTPCRIGNLRLYEILEKITKGEGTLEDLDKLKELGNTIKETALCGLGMSSPNPALSTLNHFYDEYIAHITEHKCPAGKCNYLLHYEINKDKCIGCTLCAKKCPVPCIEGEPKVKHEIIQEKCIKCGACFSVCPVNAVEKK